MLSHLWGGLLVAALANAHPLAAPEAENEVCAPTVTVHDADPVTVYVTETETIKSVATAWSGSYGSVANSGSSDVVAIGASGIYIEPSSPAVTLTPAVHWQHNLASPKHIVPAYTGDLYYSTNGTNGECLRFN